MPTSCHLPITISPVTSSLCLLPNASSSKLLAHIFFHSAPPPATCPSHIASCHPCLLAQHFISFSSCPSLIAQCLHITHILPSFCHLPKHISTSCPFSQPYHAALPFYLLIQLLLFLHLILIFFFPFHGVSVAWGLLSGLVMVFARIPPYTCFVFHNNNNLGAIENIW